MKVEFFANLNHFGTDLIEIMSWHIANNNLILAGNTIIESCISKASILLHLLFLQAIEVLFGVLIPRLRCSGVKNPFWRKQACREWTLCLLFLKSLYSIAFIAWWTWCTVYSVHGVYGHVDMDMEDMDMVDMVDMVDMDMVDMAMAIFAMFSNLNCNCISILIY